MDGDVVLGCFGGVLKTFFVTVASKCLSLFQCYNHPNGRLSMRASPEVLQGSEEWSSILVHSLGGSSQLKVTRPLRHLYSRGQPGQPYHRGHQTCFAFPQCLFLGELCQSLLFVGTGRLQG